jgi:hypothetical protein
MAKRIYYFGKTRTDGRGVGKNMAARAPTWPR